MSESTVPHSESNDKAEPWNAGMLKQLVRDSSGFGDLAVKFDKLISPEQLELLYFASYDTERSTLPQEIYCNLSEDILNSVFHYDDIKGCPVVQVAMKHKKSFDALEYDYSGIGDEKTAVYIEALRNTGHEKVLIVPMQLGRVMFALFIGISSKKPYSRIKENIISTIQTLIAGMLEKSPELFPVFRQECLSKVEAGILLDLRNGLDFQEISETRGVSELTIKIILDQCVRRLNVATYYELTSLIGDPESA